MIFDAKNKHMVLLIFTDLPLPFLNVQSYLYLKLCFDFPLS